MNAAKPALTPEQRSFLEALFKDDAAFEEDALRVYASDASLRRGPVLAMVRPRTVEQVRELMRWAEVERIPIHPRGRGTSLSGGCVPTRAGVVVSMLGMDRIFDISSEDFVAVIEPGVNTLAFQQACEQKGLFYPPDPASGKATSVGGNVMTCAGGLRAVKYGVTRDYVLGMEAVLPGGKLLKLGGRTHKDVIGLDISRFWKNIGRMCPTVIVFLAAGLWTADHAALDSWPRFFTGAAIYTLLYLPAAYAFMMDRYERELCIGVLKKLLRRRKRED